VIVRKQVALDEQFTIEFLPIGFVEEHIVVWWLIAGIRLATRCTAQLLECGFMHRFNLELVASIGFLRQPRFPVQIRKTLEVIKAIIRTNQSIALVLLVSIVFKDKHAN